MGKIAPYISDYLEIIGAVGHKEIYDRFIEKHWKKSKTKESVLVSANVEENVPKKRGRKQKKQEI